MSKSRLKRLQIQTEKKGVELPRGVDTMKIAEYCRLTGRTDPEIRALIRREWKKGIHYQRKTPPGRGITLIVSACEAYFRGKS